MSKNIAPIALLWRKGDRVGARNRVSSLNLGIVAKIGAETGFLALWRKGDRLLTN